MSKYPTTRGLLGPRGISQSLGAGCDKPLRPANADGTYCYRIGKELPAQADVRREPFRNPRKAEAQAKGVLAASVTATAVSGPQALGRHRLRDSGLDTGRPDRGHGARDLRAVAAGSRRAFSLRHGRRARPAWRFPARPATSLVVEVIGQIWAWAASTAEPGTIDRRRTRTHAQSDWSRTLAEDREIRCRMSPPAAMHDGWRSPR